MDTQLRRFTRLRQFFQGMYDRELYHSTILQGKAVREPTSLCAYLGLYTAEPYLQFTAVQMPAPQFKSAAVRALGYRIQPASPRGQAQLYTINEESRRLLNRQLWRLASSRVHELGLPVAFLAYVTTKQDNASKVIFWHRQNVPASWLLDAMQRQITQELYD